LGGTTQSISGTTQSKTYNATGGGPSIAVQATKDPMGGGKYKILVNVSCDNIFICVPT